MAFFSKKRPLKTLAELAKGLGLKPDELVDYLTRLGFSDAEIARAFDPKAVLDIIEQSCLRVLRDYQDTLTPAGANALRGRLRIIVPNSSAFNCFIDPRQDDRVVISVAAGFLFFLNKLARIYAGEMLRGSDALALPPTPGAVDEARALVEAIYDAVALGKAWQVTAQGGTPGREEFVRAMLFGQMLDAGIAHELQHAIYWTSPSIPEIPVEIRKAHDARGAMASPPAWGPELTADFFSVKMTPPSTDSAELTRQHAMFMLLEVIDLIERVTSEPESPTHPPASFRLTALAVAFPGVAKHRAVEHFHAFCHAVR